MSQAGIISMSASGNITAVNADDSTTNNNNGLFASTVGTTATVYLSNRLQGIDSAAGATTVDLVTFAAGATAGTYIIEVKVSLFESTTPAGAGYHIRGAVRTTGAATTVIGVPDEIVNEDAALAACDVDIIASANNIIIRGTGTAGLTTNFSAVAYYVFCPTL